MSPIPRLSIVSYQLAEGILRSAVAANITHVVSINDPDTRPPSSLAGHPGRHLILHFHDITEALAHTGSVPTREHMQKILKFAKKIDERHEVLVHCAAGISRSSAAALAILASKLEPSSRNALEAVRMVKAVKQMIYPNGLMVEFADELLGYCGSLVAAYNSSFRWEEFYSPPEEDDETPLDP